ncbi:hypothetical protein [Dyella monticola]|uniref:hypothetical protein n=1 Tax=Dyella monticola TaxID=1927958 RepID=UPI000E1DF3D0|nr:hypothetical protein [Dyella monticola]
MKFVDALIGAIHKSGWIAESVSESPRDMDVKVRDYNNRGHGGQIRVPLDLVKESWNKWPEGNQSLGKEKLETSIPGVLQQFAQMPHTVRVLDPSCWTP